MTKFIEESLYKTITENIVVLCVDIVVKLNNKFLLLKRTNEPLKGVFWPIGGRIYMNETAENSAKRKLLEEANIQNYNDLQPIGFYEDLFSKNAFSDSVMYHTFSIVYECTIDEHQLKNLKLDSTNSEWKLSKTLPARFKVKPFKGN
jgi:ADP-ribose pyrophosphatase YjhB (NUDIX family)